MRKKRLLFPVVCCLLALFLFTGSSFAQTKTITGKITDNRNNPVAGASIQVKGRPGGVSSNEAGVYRITLPDNADSLLISHVEFDPMTVAIRNRAVIDISLLPRESGLDAVVVVGYGTQRRRDLTGAIASVKGDAIKNLPVTNVAEALQGRVAGVEVIKASGEPGAPAQITIRGVASLNQPQPLYIVDGIRQSGDNINVQDIASIEVLKDASAASIYGSAAAGGVVIITTKKGQGAKPTVNFSARYGLTTPRVLDLLGRNDFIRFRKMINDPVYSGNTQPDTLPDTDWNDEIFRNGIEENYNLSVAGGSNAMNYFVSAVHNNQKGVFLDNSSSLSGVRVNTDIRINDWLKIGEQVYAWQRSTSPVGITPINPPFRSVPTMAVYGESPESPWGRNPAGFQGPNLVAQVKTAHRQYQQLNFQGNAYAEIALPLHLSFRTTIGYTYYNEESNYFQDVYNTGAVSNSAASLTKSVASTKTILNNYVLSFNHSFGQHAINALVGYEQFSSVYNGITSGATAVGGQSYAYLLTSDSRINLSNGGYDPNGLVKSTFGRINYDFAKKYYATFSIRRDGNFTVFGPGNQYGIFPAASAGWRLNEEPFIRELLPSVNLLKLRGSYGVLGNSNIPPYIFLSTYDIISAQNFEPGGTPVLNYTQNNMPNPDIKWESLYETNIGIDAELLNGKIFLSLDWYDKTTKDMLYSLPIPTSAGMPVSIFRTNIGSVRNRGIEFVAGYRNTVNQLNYSVSVTGAFNRNKVLNLDNINSNPILAGDNNYGNPTFGIWNGQNLSYTKAGTAFGQLYGYQVLGIYRDESEIDKYPQQAGSRANVGDLIFADIDGNKVINDKDKTVIGNPYPDFVYGINLNLNWKGFDLALLFNGVAGVDIFNGVAPYAMSYFSDGNTTSKVFGASFLGDNGLTGQPRIGVADGNGNFSLDPNHNYTWASSYFVENGSYLKLKNLQLGYNFSGSLLNRAGIKTARLYVMANNLFTITKYNGIDPELGGSVTTRGIDAPWRYPNNRIYSVGVDLSF
ncbi:MAG: TonB-dependent receptor [Candidatus Pseudobacter hemicellulosilyticus]|uniref:TonB-dependent receptor n=1 Tax=Candidatus Pseudobacter hemicellulosilyticus TaxID=3121375 RepID=A0AAJ6BI59_9BACT|nr:MAG: TonB-dependent receptor [Pseudobacter sp.]